MSLLPNWTTELENEYYLVLAAAVLTVVQGDMALWIQPDAQVTVGMVCYTFVKATLAGVVATIAWLHQRKGTPS